MATVPTIGVLALQGAFIEHRHHLQRLGAATVEVRLPSDLAALDGLIIPGGESTTIGKLMVNAGLVEPLRALAATVPLWGTCAGMILLAKAADRPQPLLEIMDITVERNAFGRQVDSFERPLDVAALEGGPFPGVFIRAPKLTAASPEVEILARLDDGSAVAAQQGRHLVTAFHPELTEDMRFHRYFLTQVQGQ